MTFHLLPSCHHIFFNIHKQQTYWGQHTINIHWQSSNQLTTTSFSMWAEATGDDTASLNQSISQTALRPVSSMWLCHNQSRECWLSVDHILSAQHAYSRLLKFKQAILSFTSLQVPYTQLFRQIRQDKKLASLLIQTGQWNGIMFRHSEVCPWLLPKKQVAG